MSGNPIADRRQRAREAYHDHLSRIETVTGMPAVEEAIEVATRVQVTDEVIRAAFGQGSVLSLPRGGEILARAFRAAGFEVVE